MALDVGQTEILIQLIDLEPERRLALRLCSELRGATRLDESLEQPLVSVASRASDELRPLLFRALALHAINSDRWELLIPQPSELAEVDAEGVVEATKEFEWESDPGDAIWNWLLAARSVGPNCEEQVYRAIENGIAHGWCVDRCIDDLFAALDVKAIGRGLRRADPGRWAAKILLELLTTAEPRTDLANRLDGVAAGKARTARANAVWCLTTHAAFEEDWDRVECMQPRVADKQAWVEGIYGALHQRHLFSGPGVKIDSRATSLLVESMSNANVASRKQAFDTLSSPFWDIAPDMTALSREVERSLAEPQMQVAALKLIKKVSFRNANAFRDVRDQMVALLEDSPKPAIRQAARSALCAMKDASVFPQDSA